MAAEHLNEVAALELACFSRPWSRQMLAEELDNQCAAFLVAVEPETEKVIGYAGLLVAADEGYITNVAVDPSRRRQGVAQQLLQVLHHRYRRISLVLLPGARHCGSFQRTSPSWLPAPGKVRYV